MGCFASKQKATVGDQDDELTDPTEKATGDVPPSKSGGVGDGSAKLLDEINDRVAGIRNKAQEYRNDLQAQVIQIEQEKADKGGDDKAQLNGVVVAPYMPEDGLSGTKLLEVNQGDRIEIIVRDTGGWAYCRLEESSKMGWLPSSRVAEIARVIADHSVDSHEGLLSVNANDYVEVINRHYSGWALCREWKGPPLPGAPPPKEGWVTDSYLEDKRSEVMLASKWHRLVLQALDQVVTSSLDLEGVLSQAKAEGCAELTMEWMGQCLDFTRWLTTELQSITQAVSQHDAGLHSGCYAIVQWDTSPSTDAELEVVADARVLVVDADNADWAWCLLESTGKEGWVPRNILSPDGEAERPDAVPKFQLKDLPSWVKEGTQARWWSTSGKRFCDVIISKVDAEQREVTVVFVVDKKCWKSVNFDHFAQPPDDWLLQPEESKALELRNQLPAWIEVGARGFWWSTSQHRVLGVKVREVCTRRRAVFVTFDIDASVRKSVPFHQLIDDPDASFLQKTEKDHAWRVRRSMRKKKKKSKGKKNDRSKITDNDAEDAAAIDLTDGEVDELDALIADDDGSSESAEDMVMSLTAASTDNHKEMQQTFAKTSKEQLSSIFDNMTQDLGDMLGGPTNANGTGCQDEWPITPMMGVQAPQLRTLADAVMDAQASPPEICRATSNGLKVANANASQLGRPSESDGEGVVTLGVPCFGVDDGANSSARVSSVCRHDMSFGLDELKQELMGINVDDPPASRRTLGRSEGGNASLDASAPLGAVAADADAHQTSSKAVTSGASQTGGTGGTANGETSRRQHSLRSVVSGSAGRPGTNPPSRPMSTSVCSVAGSTVGELRAPVFDPDNVGSSSQARGASDEDYTQSEQGIMDQLDGMSLLSEREGGGLYTTMERGLLEELSAGSACPSPAASYAKIQRQHLQEAAATGGGDAGFRATDDLRRMDDVPATEGDSSAEIAPASEQHYVDGSGGGIGNSVALSETSVEVAHIGATAAVGDGVGGASRSGADASPAPLPPAPSRLAAAAAWGDDSGVRKRDGVAPVASSAAAWGGGGGGVARPGSAESEPMSPGLAESKEEEDLKESLAAFGVEGATSSLIGEAMRAVLPDAWDSEGEGRLRKPPDVRRLDEAWQELDSDLIAAAHTRAEKLRAVLDDELRIEEAKVDAKVQDIGKRLEQRAKGAEAKLDPSGAQKYRSMEWNIMNAGETFKESLRDFQNAKASLRAEKSKRQKDCLRKALLDPAGAVVSAFMPDSSQIDGLRPAVAIDEVAEAVRELFRSVEVAAVRRETIGGDGRAEFLAKSRIATATTSFEKAGEVAVRMVANAIESLRARLRLEQDTMPPKDDLMEELQWDGLTREEKRDKKLFDGQQEFDWDRAVEKAVEARSRTRKSMFHEKQQRAERILRNRWRKASKREKTATLQNLAAFGAAVNEVEDIIRQEYRSTAERAEAEVESMDAERRSTHQQTQIMLSAALVVREEKETMNSAWYAPPKERQATMLKCLKRVRRLQEDMKCLETIPDLKQKHSVLLYSLRMLEAKLMGECQATMRDIQDGPLKLNPAQKRHLEDATRQFEEQLAGDIDRIRSSYAARAERSVSRIAADFRRTAVSQHEPSLKVARAAIDASAATAARADLAGIALRALAEVAARLSAEAVRHSEVARSPLDVPGFLPKRKRFVAALEASLTTLEELGKEINMPIKQMSSGVRAAPDREWDSAIAAAEKRWREFCATYPERELEDGNETPRSDAEVVQGRSPFRAHAGLDLGDLGEDDTPQKGNRNYSPPMSPSSAASGASPPGTRRGRRGSGQASPKAALNSKAPARARGNSPKGDRPERPPSAAPINRPPSAGGNAGPPGQRRMAFGETLGGPPPGRGSDIGAPPTRTNAGGGQGAELLAQLDDLSRNLDRALGGKTKAKVAGGKNTPAAPPRRGSLGNGNASRPSLGGGPPPARPG